MKSDLPSLLDKAFQLQTAIVRDQGVRSLAALAAELDLPQATAYRLVSALLNQGLLIRNERGRYFAGPRLLEQLRYADPVQTLATIGAPYVKQVAKAFGHVAHLGILQDDMVTYVVRAGKSSIADFAEQGAQLEAYCSGLGKVLLAGLEEHEREQYLKNGPFVRLTSQTIIDPAKLREHLAMVRQKGFALDLNEVADGLNCVALPVTDTNGVVRAAISISTPGFRLDEKFQSEARSVLHQAATAISEKMYPRQNCLM